MSCSHLAENGRDGDLNVFLHYKRHVSICYPIRQCIHYFFVLVFKIFDLKVIN